VAFVIFLASVSFSASQADAQLVVAYGPNGIQQLSFNGTELEDLGQYPSDAFRILHMKMTDLKGNLLTQGQYGWGETNNGRTWNAATATWIYNFVWGSIQVQFVQATNNLNMVVTETNSSSSGVILDGATIYPFALHLPTLPNNFYSASYPQMSFNTTGPSVLNADYGCGEVVAVVPDATKPLYSGFDPTGTGISYYPIISSTTPDFLATFQPHNDRPVQPGQTDSFTVSLRFAPSGTSTVALAGDAYASWAQTWPPQLKWSDRRPIGTIFLASSPSGNLNQPGGYPNNPRRYFNDSNSSDFDVNTPVGLAAFQVRVLQQAAANVANMQQLGAQGAITWDIEGEQYPQNTSYVCSPDQIAHVAPEMESIVNNSTSPYYGMKLDDAYFKVMTSAGFRVGICIRPQQFTLNGDGTAQQSYLSDTAVEAEMAAKMTFAHDRWGVTLFYVDSSVESDGAVLDASIFQQLEQAFPDSLIMPEESTPKHYAYTAPFLTFLNHGDLGTDPTVHAYYPNAFSVNLINDVDPGTLAASLPQLTASVKGGDVLMGLVDYWQANDPTINSIYQAAGVALTQPSQPMPTPTLSPAPTPTLTPSPTPAPAPTPVTAAVSIVTPPAGTSLSSTITVLGTVDVNLDPAGSYLMVDGVEIGTNRVTASPFNYPLDTTTLTNGPHTLQLWAHDTGNNTWLSATVSVTVSNEAPTPSASSSQSPSPSPSSPAPMMGGTYPISLTYPTNGEAISGIVQVAALISQTLDAAASYVMVDGVEATTRVGSAPYIYTLDTTQLTPGPHTIQIWAHDIGNDTLLSNPVSITVSGH
jgi:hypothetical protein